MEAKYKVTTEWDGKIYVGISLNWDYDKGTFQLSMSGYVHVEFHNFQHKNSKTAQYSPYPYTLPQYINNNQILNKNTQIKN